MNWKRFKNSLLFNVLLLVLAAILSYNAYNMVRTARTFSGESEETKKKIAELTQNKQELEARLAELQTPAAAERQAKENLNLKNPGEEVVVVVPPKNDSRPEAPSTFWGKLKNFFTRLFSRK